jgi:hypothetical protein
MGDEALTDFLSRVVAAKLRHSISAYAKASA